jgi:hypothetical protein
LARPGRISGQVRVEKIVPRSGAQGLRRLLQRGRNALHHAEHHQIGRRREGQRLRDEHAGQAVDPARGRNAEPAPQQRRHRARTAEDQDQRQPDDEGRGDDRQDGQQLQAALERKARAQRDQREGKAKHGGGEADENAEEHRVPRHPAGVPPPRQPRPQIEDIGDLLANRAGAKWPALSSIALARMVATGRNTNSAISATTQPIELTTKTSPRHQPCPASPTQAASDRPRA